MTREMNNILNRDNFLTFFTIHYDQIRGLTTVDETLLKIREERCPFEGLRSHFKGDGCFREMRRYYVNNSSPELRERMIQIVKEEEVKDGQLSITK